VSDNVEKRFKTGDDDDDDVDLHASKNGLLLSGGKKINYKRRET
jgi:hypothetical protein